MTTKDLHSHIKTAAELLHRGELVALPTETVYGLGGNACDDNAVAKIYAAKGRPQFNPLITHVENKEAAFRYGAYDVRAEKLMDAFWPGPLTIILPRQKDCALSLLVSAGLDCIGLRAPAHPLAQTLLKESGLPLAAPSANRSGHVSPTTAAHVAEEFGEDIMILDGGACPVGIESTVLDLTGEPTLLRPGSVTKEAIEKVIGKIQIAGDGTIKSPGMLESHYAPNAQLRLNALQAEEGEALLAFGPVSPPLRGEIKRGAISDSSDSAPTPALPLKGEGVILNLSQSSNLTEAAANLFSMLRSLDKQATRIAVSPIPMEGLGLAINDRLMRAAAPKSRGATFA